MNTSKQKYSERYTPTQLKEEADRILRKFPDRIPILIEKDLESDIEDIDKNKFLVPSDLKYSAFLIVIRKRIKLNPEKGLFIYAGNTMLNSTDDNMGQIYEQYRDISGFLILLYAGESVFG